MKIDSIFSTFDNKFECVTIRLDSATTLSGNNRNVVALAFQAYSRLLVDVLFVEDPVVIWGKVSAFYNCIKVHPLLSLQACFDYIHQLILIDGIADAADFKGRFFDNYGKFANELGIMVWSFLGTLIQKSLSGDDFALVNLASACKFFSKLELDLPELEDACIASYKESEEYIATHSDYDSGLIKALNSIIREWLRDFDPTFLPVRHGHGSVADARRYKFDKYNHLATDRKLDLGIKWLHGYLPVEYYPYETNHRLVRCSRYITVPKSLTKRRGISMEPASLQYFQQGVMRLLYDYIGKKLPQIPLRFQATNQICAYLGSKFNYYCTVDLSAASDSVSYKLVKELFKGTRLLKYLICTRSSHTKLPNKETIELKKFAPMGSALCFPVESLIFAACCEFTGRHAKSKWGMETFSYSTYGDDMIIDNCLYGPLTVVLNELGFKVNQDKSFHTGPFRESCGKEYHRGIDVTPLKYRLTVKSWDHIAAIDYSAICSLVNGCSQRSYFQLRRFLLSKIIGRRPGPLFISEYGFDPFIYSTHNTNFNNKKRWNYDYHRCEVKYLNVGTRVDRSLYRLKGTRLNQVFDEILYQEWLIQRHYITESLVEIGPTKYSLLASDTIYQECTYLL